MKRLLSSFICAAILATPQANAQTHCDDLSSADKGHCLSDYGDFLEKQMVSAYKNLLRALDNAPDTIGQFDQRARETLQPSQAAFEAFRKYFCEFETNLTAQGSGYGNALAQCRNSATEQRIQYLKNITSQVDG